jgi:hypothetical protein
LTDFQLKAGDVEVVLDGEKLVLRPTLNACQTVSRMTGGIMDAIRRVGNYDFDLMVTIIALGLDLKSKRDVEALPDRVWRTGMNKVARPVLQYLSVIANGGRPLEDGEEDPPEASA